MAPKYPARVTKVADVGEEEARREREFGRARVMWGLPAMHAQEV